MDYMGSAYLYIIGAVIAVFVLAQSVFFLVRAVRRGREIGLSDKAMKDAAVSSATFSIVPSVPIVLAMIALAATIGAPFAWIRLSVIGSMSYETMAASAVASAASCGPASCSRLPAGAKLGGCMAERVLRGANPAKRTTVGQDAGACLPVALLDASPG